MLRSFILNNASAKHLENWLYDWGKQHKLFLARNRDKEVDEHGAPWDGGWFVYLQVLLLSAERCELRIEWTDSAHTQQKPTRYVEGMVKAISKRWEVDEQLDTPHPGAPAVRSKVKRGSRPTTVRRNRDALFSALLKKRVQPDQLDLEVVRDACDMTEVSAASRKISTAGLEGINGLASAYKAWLSKQGNPQIDGQTSTQAVKKLVKNRVK